MLNSFGSRSCQAFGPDLGPNYLKSYEQKTQEIKESYGTVFTAYSCRLIIGSVKQMFLV